MTNLIKCAVDNIAIFFKVKHKLAEGGTWELMNSTNY